MRPSHDRIDSLLSYTYRLMVTCVHPVASSMIVVTDFEIDICSQDNGLPTPANAVHQHQMTLTETAMVSAPVSKYNHSLNQCYQTKMKVVTILYHHRFDKTELHQSYSNIKIHDKNVRHLVNQAAYLLTPQICHQVLLTSDRQASDN